MTAGSSPESAKPDEPTRVSLESWLVTDVGMVREHNEDSASMESGQGFFIVADGMGGHAAGEVASAMAVENVKKTLEQSKDEIDAFKKSPSDAGRRQLVQLLQSAVLQAHQAVYQRGQAESDKQGMGTTLDVVLVAGAEAFVAHVGDSRTYLVREGRSSQITTDHTVAEVLVIEGKLTIEEAQVSPLRTILVNAIGVSADVGVEMAHVTLKRNDRLLLCSDGLHDYFPAEEEIAQRLSADKPGEALAEMVELAKTRGGHDNITGVAVLVAELHEAVPVHFGDESTHPVDVGNPFMTDEPTQTAMVSGFAKPPAAATVAAAAAAAAADSTLPSTPSSTRSTQPMRAIDVEATEPPAITGDEETGEHQPAKAAAADAGDDAKALDKTLDDDVKASEKSADEKSADEKPPAAAAKSAPANTDEAPTHPDTSGDKS